MDPALELPSEFKTQPYEHQLAELEGSWWRPSYGYFWEMGCGKSWLAINCAARLYDAAKIDALCVVAPKGVYRNWTGEIDLHLHERVERRIAVWSPSRTKRKAHEIAGVMAPIAKLRVFLVNVEALSTKRGREAMAAFLHSSSALLVVDESTSVKSRDAQRTKAIVTLARFASYRRIMTGSPVTQSPLDLYGQLSVLEPKPLGFASFYAFRNRYAVTEKRQVTVYDDKRKRDITREYTAIVDYRRIDELKERLRDVSSRVLKSECLDLPEKIFQRREVSFTAEQEGVYRDLVRESKARLENEVRVTAPQVITQVLRLHQVTCGFVKTDDGEERAVRSNRMAALMELLEEASGKVIIWAPYRYSIFEIANTLREAYGGESFATYFGGTSADDRELAKERFQTSDRCRFFVGNAQTAGYGLTLTAASTVIYFANSHKLEERLQSEDRAHRIGQRNAVTYVDLVVPGTVDERIVSSLRSKKHIADAVLGEEWREWL